MADRLEQNFASLAIPIHGLRDWADLNNGEVLVGEHLENHEEIRLDLEAALSAGKREDPNWLTGRDIVAEIHDENSPYRDRSAYRIFGRAAAFESILTRSKGNFPPCPNQEIIDLEGPVKSLRDWAYQNGSLLSLFPETVVERQLYADQLSKGLETARQDRNLNFLSGWEVLSELGTRCENTHALDLFWQSALAGAWVAGEPTIPVARTTSAHAEPSAAPSASVPSSDESEKKRSSPSAGPSPAVPYTGVPPYSSNTPKPGASPGVSPDTLELAKDVAGGTVDLALAGGGAYFQRGVVAEYKMTFEPATFGERTELVLQEVDRIPRTAVKEAEPLRVESFKGNEKKIFEKGRKEAEILWERGKAKGQPPQEIVRTGVKRGWVKGAISPRRIFGWGTMAVGLADLALRFFRDDDRGLEGPLTDAGMSPLGSRLALVGAGVVGLGAIILTGGLAAPVVAGLATISTVGLMVETQTAFDEANAELDKKLKSADSQDRPPPKPIDITINHRFVA